METETRVKKEKKLPILHAWVIIIFVAFTGFCAVFLTVCPHSKTSSSATLRRATFEQIGYFKSDGMRAFTFYGDNLNKKDIDSFMAEIWKTYGELTPPRALSIRIYDARSHTPDISGKIDYPPEDEPYLIVSFFNNPFNGFKEYKFYKEMPEN